MIELRTLTEADIPAYLAGEDEHVVRWVTHEPATEESARSLFAQLAKNQKEKKGRQGFGIWCDGSLSGYIEIDPSERPGVAVGEVAVQIYVHANARRHGVATAALNRIRHYISEEDLGHTAVLRIEATNWRAVKLARRAGFIASGLALEDSGPLLCFNNQIGAPAAWDSQYRSLKALFQLTVPKVSDEVQAVCHSSRCGRVGGFFQPTLPIPLARPASVLSQSRRIALQTGLPQFIWAMPGSAMSTACWQEGFKRTPALAAMELNSIPEGDVSAATLITDHALADAWRGVHHKLNSEYENPIAVVSEFGRDEVLLNPNIRAVMVSDWRSGPASVGMLLVTGNIGGIYWVGTNPNERRQGHADRVMQALLGHATIAGCDKIVVQTTTMGRPLFQRFGFKDHGLIDKWIVPPER